MKKTVLWLSTLLIWTSLAAASPLSSAAIQEQPSSPQPAPKIIPDAQDRLRTIQSPTFDNAVNQWVKSIAKEKGFEAWSSATWSSSPLGPGTHGWIVLLKSGGLEVGYLVINAMDSNQYQLSEYGSGSSPLFSLTTLYRSLVQLGIMNTSYEAERWYSDPLHAVWIVTVGEQTYIIDAMTGELLPLTSKQQLLEDQPVDSADFISPAQVTPQHSITANEQLAEFDPYENMSWLLKQPMDLTAFTGLQPLLDSSPPAKLVFNAELYGGKVIVPLAVSGYQQWSNDEVYLQLEQNGHRAIPYRYAVTAGHLIQ